jgi:hypothetical protein
MIAERKEYTTELLKGTGLIQETILLLDIYEPGITKSELLEKAINSNVLVKDHNNRIKDIVNRIFYRRYFSFGEETVLALKQLRQNHISINILSQLFFVYTCRTNSVLFDFITSVYQRLYLAGERVLPDNAAITFINEAIKIGDIEPPWSDSTKLRVARHIIATITDFKLIDSGKNMLPLFLDDIVVNYLAHELHFKGVPDTAIIDAHEWKLFGYDRNDIIKQLERVSFKGHYIFQSSGELIKINWRYKNMKDLANAIG